MPMKNENKFIFTTMPADFMDLGAKAQESVNLLKDAMYLVCIIHILIFTTWLSITPQIRGSHTGRE